MDGTDQLAQAHPLLTAILDTFDGPVVVLDKRGDVVIVNQTWIDLSLKRSGDTSQGWIGQNYLTLCQNVMGMRSWVKSWRRQDISPPN